MEDVDYIHRCTYRDNGDEPGFCGGYPCHWYLITGPTFAKVKARCGAHQMKTGGDALTKIEALPTKEDAVVAEVLAR